MATFGVTTSTYDARDADANYIWGGLATCAESGTGVSIHVYLQEANGLSNILCKAALYTSGYALVANGTTDEITLNASTQEWRTLNFTSGPSLTAQDYIICFKFSNQVWNHRTTASSGFTSYYKAHTYATAFPDPITMDGTRTSDKLNAYVTYTAGGGGGWAHKLNGVAAANIAKINGIPIANIAKINGV